MLLWLPFFTSSALAVATSMQLPQGNLDKLSVTGTLSDEMMAMDECPMQQADSSPSSGVHTTCEICHFVGAGYLPMPNIEIASAQTASAMNPNSSVSFISITTTPPLPPPLLFVTAG
ncbi:MAG: hypothetical protein Q8O24_10060 [Gallionellaceae bacterium]|nr:hypothetical protein [Gallionellaceae bacterium]